jgi:tellurite resistance protein
MTHHKQPLARSGIGTTTPIIGERKMNLFAGLKGRGAEIVLDVQTAVMIPIVAAMLADGRVEEEEILQIEAICATSPIFERNSAAENERIIMHATRMIEDHSPRQMCERATAMLSPALCETAFVYAVKVIFSDGYVGQVERDVVESLIDWLGIDPDRARTMIDVVSVMQHPVNA